MTAGPEPTTRSASLPPRTLVLVGPLPPPSGGMANQTRQLGELLGREGCAVRIVRTNAPVRPAWVARLRGVRALFRLVPYAGALWRGMSGADVVHVMANSGWSWHLCAAPAIWIGVLRRVPVVVNYRGGEAARFLARQRGIVAPTLARARALLVPSGFLREIFAEHGFAASEVPNIVNLDAFRPAERPPAEPHFVVTRNLEPIYDNATALRAFANIAALHPAAHMTIAGEGPDREALMRLAFELGMASRVRFTGTLDNAELPALYQSASALVNPSTVDNMPISLLEAMASGVPIVSTSVGGVPYVVEHDRTALLVPSRDPQAMASALLRLLDEPRLAERLAQAGIALARRYAWTEVRPALFDAYAVACSDSSNGPSVATQSRAA